jgi:hypothetical protein
MDTDPADAGRKFVRVTGCRDSNLIEFDLAVDPAGRFVGLTLPEPAFAEFCRHNEVTLLQSAGNPVDFEQFGTDPLPPARRNQGRRIG